MVFGMRIVPIPGEAGGLRRLASLAAVAGLAAVVGCGSGGDGAASAGEDRLTVVAGFYPLAEAAARVGGDRVDVVDLTPAGSEPHDLELVPDQVEDLEDADLVLVLGRGFQPAVEQVAGRRDGATVALLDALGVPGGEVGDHEEGEEGHEDEAEEAGLAGDGGDTDPHVWLDPTRMADIADEVAAALATLDPDARAAFESAAATYRQELEALDASFERALGACRGDTIVVAHEAFGWLAARYGLVQQAISGLAPGAEPSPARLSELADLVQEEGVTTVFTETLVSPRVAEALAREAGVGTAVLDPLEGLADDRQAEGASYVTVMEENLATLEEALDCG
jgi:zinc transport system substrate-binding protein